MTEPIQIIQTGIILIIIRIIILKINDYGRQAINKILILHAYCNKWAQEIDQEERLKVTNALPKEKKKKEK